MWEKLIVGESRDGYGFILEGSVNDIGYQSICVPASLKAYYTAQREYGALPWSEIVQPAIAWAEAGWTVRPHVQFFWAEQPFLGSAPGPERLRYTPSGRALYCRPDGSPKRVGDMVRNPDLAGVLRLVAAKGADVFYAGEIAERIAEDMRAKGGLISRDDLRALPAAPAAAALGRVPRLQARHQQPAGRRDHAGRDAEHPGEIRSFRTRPQFGGIPAGRRRGDEAGDDRQGPPCRRPGVLRRAGRAADRARTTQPALAAEIAAGQKADVPRLNTGTPSKDTTQISVIDREGNCVTMTHSLGMPSGVITDGLGFMYNGCMAVFDPRPGRAGSIAPGKARFSSVCPSIVFRDDAPYLVIGAPGATQIAMGVLQAILNVLDFGMTMTEAVSAARFSATSNAIDVSNRIPRYVTRELEAQGYEVVRSPYTFGFASVHGIRVTDQGLDGGADPGHDGVALAV